MNTWGTRIALIHVAIQGPIVTYPKIVEPWRAAILPSKYLQFMTTETHNLKLHLNL